MKSVATIAELRGYLSEQRRILVCFWKKGCPGCMAASKVIDLLHGPDCAVLGFDCTGGMKEAKALGVDNTPYWVLFERGEKSAEIRPTSDGEALHRFLTEKAGFALPEPILMAALEDGREYARNVQAAIAEILFRRADSDEDTLISAARLMILKACAGEDDIPACVDRQIAYCARRLTENGAGQEGYGAQKRRAAERLAGERDRLAEDLEALRGRMKQ